METAPPTLSSVEREGNALGGIFQNIITDLRNGANNWDDLLLKANKFHVQLRSTINASTAFLDAFQKIADMATTTRGGTKEIGSALTRLCLRNRSVEAKLKSLTSSLFDSFISPLQDRVDEWKKIIVQIDKEHNKEIKRLKQFRKKSETRTSSGFSNNTFRMKKHPRNKTKTDFSRIGSLYDIDKIIESMDNKEKFFMLEEVERTYVRRALIEERSHYCLFFNLLRPVIQEEISMLQEIVHLEEILTTLTNLTADPGKLPASSEHFLTNLQLNPDPVTGDYAYSSIHNSAMSTVSHSRKSSISSMDSFNTLSTDSISFKNCKSLSQPNINPSFRPKSIASQDSGFLSHDYNIPNVGRLVLYNKNKITSNNKDSVCILNGKPIIAAPRVETIKNKELNDNINGEYATSESLFHNSQCQQPIYVNIHNSDDGYSNATGANIEQINKENHYKISNKPKPCPPKPPVRYSSKLSTDTLENYDNISSKRSTLIYVQSNENASMDFPPPPPEAYMTTIRQPPTSNTTKMNECCRYSVPSSHLVFCDNKECLTNHFETIIPANSAAVKQHYGSLNYLNMNNNNNNNNNNVQNNAYSFESNVDQEPTWKTADFYEKTCDGTNYNHSSFDPRYHSSVNLSSDH